MHCFCKIVHEQINTKYTEAGDFNILTHHGNCINNKLMKWWIAGQHYDYMYTGIQKCHLAVSVVTSGY